MAALKKKGKTKEKRRNCSVFQAFNIPSGHSQALQVHGMEVAVEVGGGR